MISFGQFITNDLTEGFLKSHRTILDDVRTVMTDLVHRYRGKIPTDKDATIIGDNIYAIFKYHIPNVSQVVSGVKVELSPMSVGVTGSLSLPWREMRLVIPSPLHERDIPRIVSVIAHELNHTKQPFLNAQTPKHLKQKYDTPDRGAGEEYALTYLNRVEHSPTIHGIVEQLVSDKNVQSNPNAVVRFLDWCLNIDVKDVDRSERYRMIEKFLEREMKISSYHAMTYAVGVFGRVARLIWDGTAAGVRSKSVRFVLKFKDAFGKEFARRYR